MNWYTDKNSDPLFRTERTTFLYNPLGFQCTYASSLWAAPQGSILVAGMNNLYHILITAKAFLLIDTFFRGPKS